MSAPASVTRRRFLAEAAAASCAAPLVVSSTAWGANDRITMGAIGVGGRGRSDMNGAMHRGEIRVLAVCDVDRNFAARAKSMVDGRYGNSDCKVYGDFRRITERRDIDTVLIGTPDHWHAIIAVEAMKGGKDVFCEKPETLTVRQGRIMTEVARRYARVFSGGSQRVWQDYHWYHKMVRGGAIGEVKEAWVNVGGPSGNCHLAEQPIPDHLDWDMWLGPAPWHTYHQRLHPFHWRWYRDYSGGGMTDWGCHSFGGALFACNLHETGPVEIHPPGGEYELLTYIFANGVRIYHKGAWGGRMSFRGTDGFCPPKGQKAGQQKPPDINIPHYHGGRGSVFDDFLACVKTRERPFRDIEIAHRTATHCHLGNIAYWLKRSIKWDPEKEEIVGDEGAARWLDRPMRKPWTL